MASHKTITKVELTIETKGKKFDINSIELGKVHTITSRSQISQEITKIATPQRKFEEEVQSQIAKLLKVEISEAFNVEVSSIITSKSRYNASRRWVGTKSMSCRFSASTYYGNQADKHSVAPSVPLGYIRIDINVQEGDLRCLVDLTVSSPNGEIGSSMRIFDRPVVETKDVISSIKEALDSAECQYKGTEVWPAHWKSFKSIIK